MNEQAFLSALHENPCDEVTWLALADWLEEHGQADRAELLRISRRLRGQPVSRRTRERRSLEARLVRLILGGTRPVVPEVVNGVGMRFALVPPGRFRMGSPRTEPLREHDEEAHEVEISRPFYLGVFPVTQSQYERVIGENPSLIVAGQDLAELEGVTSTADFPVENVDHDEAVAFCGRLAALPAERDAGRTYRLPTEAEWEYACRAGVSSFTFFGDSLPSTLANFDGDLPYNRAAKGPNLERTCPVGAYPPNAWGLYDLHGQVWEWCSDWYDSGYDLSRAARQDPQGPMEGEYRVVRGGCWMVSGDYCRSASRAYAVPEERDEISGFRVVLIPGGGGR
jgi:uncharacterized protein (TIGR02996 family)